MEINDQIRHEREIRNLSRDEFKESLFESTGLNVSSKTIQRWEEGVLPNIIELQCLAEFFGIKASDLLDEKKDPFVVSRNELYDFGENLLGYSLMANLNDLMSVYYITKKNNSGFESVPRYDIELQGVNFLLSSSQSYSEAIRFANHLFDWIERCQKIYSSENEKSNEIFLHDDSVGSRSYFDPRTILDAEEMILIKEGIISELYWFNQEISEYLYDKSNGKMSSNLSFIRRKIYS